MTKTRDMLERVFICIKQYEGVGASASEVSDEMKAPLHEIIEYVGALSEDGRIVATRTLRPWKINAPRDLANARRVHVAAHFREEAI